MGELPYLLLGPVCIAVGHCDKHRTVREYLTITVGGSASKGRKEGYSTYFTLWDNLRAKPCNTMTHSLKAGSRKLNNINK